MSEGDPGEVRAGPQRAQPTVDEIDVVRGLQRSHDAVMLRPHEERRPTPAGDRREYPPDLPRRGTGQIEQAGGRKRIEMAVRDAWRAIDPLSRRIQDAIGDIGRPPQQWRVIAGWTHRRMV